MTYPAPPPELPPQTAPQVVVQTPPDAIARPEPVAPAPLRQVIQQLPPATAQDLGRPIGVVDVSTIRESTSEGTTSGDRPTPAASPDLNDLAPTPSLPPLNYPPVHTATPPTSGQLSPPASSTPVAPSTTNDTVTADRPARDSLTTAVPGQSPSQSRRSPVVPPRQWTLALEDEGSGDRPEQAQTLKSQEPRSPFAPEPLNPAEDPVTPALPPTNRTPGTRTDKDETGQPTGTAEPAPTGTAPTPNPNVRRLDLPTNLAGAVEVTADQQEYDEIRNVVIATGNAVVRFQGAIISGDRVQINLNNRIALAEGEVGFKRGQQLLRGERLEYNLVQGDGILLEGYGEIDRRTLGPDLSSGEAVVGPYNPSLDRPLSDRITGSDPLTDVRQAGQFAVEVGTGEVGIVDAPPGQTGEVQNFRFEADRVEFDPNGWIAENARLTNDPFSPPELEIRSPRLRFQRLSPLRDELVAEKGRWVIDDSFSFPLIPSRTVFDRRERPPEPFRIRFDQEERGGLFIERTFTVLRSPQWRLDLTPQFHVQRAFTDSDSGILSPDAWGGKARLVGNITPKLSVLGVARFSSFDFDEFDDRFRGSLRANQIIDTPWGPHTLSAEYSFRDRLFNGTFGFQTIRRSIGAVLTSPQIPIGKTQATLQYQASAQNITARTDRPFLLKPVRDNDLITLDRIQVGAILRRNFLLWRGNPLPATAEEGLRYTPTPVRPFLRIVTRLRAFSSNYSNGGFQNTIAGTVGLQGQFGHFSRPWFDYTAFNIAYQQRWRNGESPFLFDRVGEDQVVGFGLTQQIYGPFRVGFQAAYSIDREELIDSSFTIDYSRRTFGIGLRFNPERQQGSLIFRITDFNWSGNGSVFDDDF